MGGRAAIAAPGVPFLDLGRVHADLKDEVLDAFAGLIDSGQFTNGPDVARFEAEFASYCGAEHCAQALSLPLFPGITQDELALVAGAIREYFGGG